MGGNTRVGSLMRRKKLSTVPTHLVRALASVKAGAEWDLLRAVEQAARHYRRAQQALAHREELGGGEEEFKRLLDAVALCHHQLDRALFDIQRYYESTGAPQL